MCRDLDWVDAKPDATQLLDVFALVLQDNRLAIWDEKKIDIVNWNDELVLLSHLMRVRVQGCPAKLELCEG